MTGGSPDGLVKKSTIFQSLGGRGGFTTPGSQAHLVLSQGIVHRFCGRVCGFDRFGHRRENGNGLGGKEMIVQEDSEKPKIGSEESRSSQWVRERERPISLRVIIIARGGSVQEG